jgi:solute carrier family 45 protein 1/2/4
MILSMNLSANKTLRWGTPFLVGLGLSETATSLVWLAGPLSGLIAQPLIGEYRQAVKLEYTTLITYPGAISDSSTSQYRRRIWISSATALLCLSLTTLAYCEPWARFFVESFGSCGGDWDPKCAGQVNITYFIMNLITYTSQTVQKLGHRLCCRCPICS